MSPSSTVVQGRDPDCSTAGGLTSGVAVSARWFPALADIDICNAGGAAGSLSAVSGGTIIVSASAGMSMRQPVSGGGNFVVGINASATNTTLSGGSELVYGGTDSGGLLRGGQQYIYGVAFCHSMRLAASRTVQSGGESDATTIALGGTEQVSAGAIVKGTTILGGTLEIVQRRGDQRQHQFRTRSPAVS